VSVRGVPFKLEIWLVSQTTRVTDQQLRRMQAAYSIAGAECAAAWGSPTPSLAIADRVKEVPDHGVPIVYSPSIDAPGDLAYHTFFDGRPSALVLADDTVSRLELETGGSHELFEMIGDFDVSEWVTLPSGSKIAQENCDGTQGDELALDIGAGEPVAVSNWLTPAWFDDEVAPGTKLDAAGLVEGPRIVRPGGYSLIIDASGNIRQVGEGPAAYKRHPAFRHGRRLASAHQQAFRIKMGRHSSGCAPAVRFPTA
jgi:hypothetical protein